MSLPLIYMAKTKNYTDKEFVDAVKNSLSYRQILKKLGIKLAGGNYKTIQKKIKELNLDISHFKGQGYLKGKTHNYRKKSIDYYLTENSHHQSYKLKLKLFSEGIKENKCENCGLTEWLGNSIPLELDHIDGVNTNNTLENLRILCPNCHSQTITYRGKNIKT